MAWRALALRCSCVNASFLAGPPFKPPIRPNATACGFFRVRPLAVCPAVFRAFFMPPTIPDRSRMVKKIVVDLYVSGLVS
jgi:hypothetical protein